MYLYDAREGEEARNFVREPLPSGGEWPEVADQVDKVEVWASSIDDQGDDHYVIVVYDVDRVEIGRKEVEGY